MNTPKLPAADGYGRRQVLVILSGLLLATFLASLDQTVATAAMYRIGESLNGLTPPRRGWLPPSSSLARLCAPSPHRCPCWRSSAPSRASGAGGIFALISAVLGDIVPPRECAK